MARGGRRQGRSGVNYSQRSDLQQGARLPIATGPSQQYGQRAAAEEQQRALPLVRPGAPASPAPGGAATPPAPPPPLTAPTAAPDEPVTAGSAFGAGPGPEVLGGSAFEATTPYDDDVAAMRRYLPALELMASLPTATPATRHYVRRLRAAMPVE